MTTTAISSPQQNRWWLLVGLLLALVFLVAGSIWWIQSGSGIQPIAAAKPDPIAATDANSRGVGLMEQFEYAKAAAEFETAVKLAPDWLPAKINLGMALYNSAAAATDPVLPKAIAVFEDVLKAEPDNPYAHFNLGIILKYQAKFEPAQLHFRKVLEVDPTDDRAWLYLGQAFTDQQSNEECKTYFQKALDLNPYLVSAWFALANHATTSEAEQTAKLDLLLKLQAANWEDEARPDKHSEQGRYATVIGRGLVKPAAIGPLPLFEQRATWTVDAKINWEVSAIPMEHAEKEQHDLFGDAMVRLDFDGDDKPDLLLLGGQVKDGKRADLLLHNTGSGFEDVTAASGLSGNASVSAAVADSDNDGRPDLILGTPTGLRLLRNFDGKRFEDKTKSAGLDTIQSLISSVLWLDIDQDGDLDLLVGSPIDKLVVFQNIGEAPPSRADEPTPPLTSKFKRIDLPNLAVNVRVTGFLATDVDGDKDIDLVVFTLNAAPVVILNDRLMRFRMGPALPGADRTLHTGVIVDANGDDQSDLVLLGDQKPVFLVSTKDTSDIEFRKRFVAGQCDAAPLRYAQRCDLDADGRCDLVGLNRLGQAVFLQGDGEGKLTNRAEPFGGSVTNLGVLSALTVMDMNGDGTPDVVVRSASGLQTHLGISNGNHTLKLAFTGARDNNTAGSGQKNLRCNTSGIGIKCRTLTGPLQSLVELTTLSSGPGQSLLPVEIGIGQRTQCDAVRLRWPDCVVQAELGIQADRVVTIREINRKPTSCPVLMTWDGEKWVYVTDFLGGGALGESGTDGTVRPPRPQESVKIESQQLGLKNGKYILRIAEPMDEVMYLDHLRLTVVDHPSDTVIFPDERFTVTAPAPTEAILAFRNRYNPTHAHDHRGTDHTKTVSIRDGKTVSDFAKRSWLGFAEEHWLEFDFAKQLHELPGGTNPYLILAGWTDYAYPESIFAAGQAGIEPLPPVLERRKTDGTWEKVCDLGFPAGLPKTITVPVRGLMDPKFEGRYRIRTNLHVYWDQVSLGVAEELAYSQEVMACAITLSHPGCVQEISTNGKPPQAYDPSRFEAVATTNWQGHLTKLGSVLELLTSVDDRLAICGPGDELLCEFDGSVLPKLRPGWTRSFVLRSHGYCKDTAPTTQTGGDVNPLPYRAMRSYPHRDEWPVIRASDKRDWHNRPAGNTPR